MERLEATCRALPALWRGEYVGDHALGLSHASLGPIEIDPPRLVVGGKSDRAIAIAVEYADAWNLSTPDPAEFEAARARADHFRTDRGGERTISAEAQLWVRDLWRDPRSHLRAFEDTGAELVILVLDEERGPGRCAALPRRSCNSRSRENGDVRSTTRRGRRREDSPRLDVLVPNRERRSSDPSCPAS